MEITRASAASLVVLAVALVAGVALGFALAIGATPPDPIEERWARLGVPEPRVDFAGDFTDAERAVWVRELKSAQAFFHERFGAVASDFTAYFGDDRDAFLAALTGVSDWDAPLDCVGLAEDGAFFILLAGCRAELRERGGPIAHEYFHILQRRLAGDGVFGDGGEAEEADAPLAWLVEGSAVYADVLHATERGRWSLAAQREGARLALSALEGGEEAIILKFSPYEVGFLASDWLAVRAGERALLDYFRFGSGEEAFERAFGMGVDAFLDAFRQHRREVAPPFTRRIAGTVLGPDGEPVGNLQVVVQVELLDSFASVTGTITDAAGAFAFTGPEGGYTLGLVLVCEPGTGPHGAYPFALVGEWGADGFLASENGRDPSGATPFADAPRDRTDIAITLPETPEALAARLCPAR